MNLKSDLLKMFVQFITKVVFIFRICMILTFCGNIFPIEGDHEKYQLHSSKHVLDLLLYF